MKLSLSFNFRQPERKTLHAEFCGNFEHEMFTWGWDSFKLPSQDEAQQWISDNGFKIVKKKEATMLLVVGEKNSTGLWIPKQHKNYWLTKK